MDAGRVSQIWDCEANAKCPQILPCIQETSDKHRSRQWSSRGQKLYKTICATLDPAGGAYSAPQTPRLVGRGS